MNWPSIAQFRVKLNVEGQNVVVTDDERIRKDDMHNIVSLT